MTEHWLNAERVRSWFWVTAAILPFALLVWLALFGLSSPSLVDPGGGVLGKDFIAFWSAARLALSGSADAVYNWSAVRATELAAIPTASRPNLPVWVETPTWLLAVLPFGLLPYPAALAAFMAGTAALWAALARCMLPARPLAWVIAAGTPVGLVNLIGGQNGFLTAALAGFALLLLRDRRSIAAGVLIGLIAVKPHLGLLFPIALVADRQWRAFAAAGITLLLMCAASAAAFGWPIFAAFVHDLPSMMAVVDRGGVTWGQIPTPYIFARSLGLAPGPAHTLQYLSAACAAACVWRAWRGEAAFEAKAATLIAGSLLVSPYLSTYDLTWAALAVGWLAILGLRDGFARFEREILAFAWLAPAIMAQIWRMTAVQIGVPALVFLLVIAMRRATSSKRSLVGLPQPQSGD